MFENIITRQIVSIDKTEFLVFCLTAYLLRDFCELGTVTFADWMFIAQTLL